MLESVTIAICTWNRAKPLDRVLAAMASLRIPDGLKWDVLVVNNNCTDDTEAVVAKHRAMLPIRSVLESVPGISHARNRAVMEATGEGILWIDDDAVPDPEWVAAHVEAFDGLGADLVIGKVEPLWERGTPPAWFIPEFNGMFALLDYGDQTRRITDPAEGGFNVNMGFRRELAESIGAYRVDIGTGRLAGGEDQDLCLRAHEAGKVVVYQPKALVRHIIPASRCTKRFYRRYMWVGSPNHLRLLQDEARSVPKLFGLPRYFLRKNLEFVGLYAKAVLNRRKGEAFFYELKMIRLVGLFWNMLFRRDPLKDTKRVGE